ncbi:MAG: BamA/TamA family outer membrane protein [Chromatiales bacterium]|jgi:hypothetical protein
MTSSSLKRIPVAILMLSLSMTATAEEEIDKTAGSWSEQFIDVDDGWFDLSSFLDKAHGFVPVISPITEPAVGYGAVGALVFVDRDTSGKEQAGVRPNIAAVGAMATENGSRGKFAAHLGTWMDGNLRTLIGIADTDINLEFFGLGGERNLGQQGLDYTIAARGGVIGGSYRLGKSPFWAGLRYVRATTNVSLDVGNSLPPQIPSLDLELNLGALTPSLTYDTRDNFFTPTHGLYLDLSATLFRQSLGSDRDFEKATFTAIGYQPLTENLYLGARASGTVSSDGTPFYLRPFVSLRGVQAMKYQGEEAAEIEAELRWQFHPRFSLVGFGGAGLARSESRLEDSEKRVTSGGAGFRYLLARRHGLHMGIDVAVGPDDPIFYVVFGTAWLRP